MGKGIIRELASFIKLHDPELKGFSNDNLWRVNQFYETYGDDEKLATLWRVLPWSHNRRIMTLKTAEEREFYLYLSGSSQKKYSFRELERIIKTSTFERIILADEKLSPTVAELPESTQSIFKDSYMRYIQTMGGWEMHIELTPVIHSKSSINIRSNLIV